MRVVAALLAWSGGDVQRRTGVDAPLGNGVLCNHRQVREEPMRSSFRTWLIAAALVALAIGHATAGVGWVAAGWCLRHHRPARSWVHTSSAGSVARRRRARSRADWGRRSGSLARQRSTSEASFLGTARPSEASVAPSATRPASIRNSGASAMSRPSPAARGGFGGVSTPDEQAPNRTAIAPAQSAVFSWRPERIRTSYRRIPPRRSFRARARARS